MIDTIQAVREFLATRLAPNMARDAERYWRLRNGLEVDRWWLMQDCPHAYAAMTRALEQDREHWDDEKPSITKWPADISEFRDWLRKGRKPYAAGRFFDSVQVGSITADYIQAGSITSGCVKVDKAPRDLGLPKHHMEYNSKIGQMVPVTIILGAAG